MLYAIRHGETDLNAKGIIQGCKIDIGLNDKGILQAKSVAKELVDKNIGKIYSSNMKRAKQTSNIVNELLSVEIFYSALLRETDYGVLQGKSIKEVQEIEEYKNIFERADAGDNDISFPEGESRNQVAKRFLKFLSSIKDEKDKNILIVSHGALLRSVVAVITGKDKYIPNCGLVKFDLDENHYPKNIEVIENLKQSKQR